MLQVSLVTAAYSIVCARSVALGECVILGVGLE